MRLLLLKFVGLYVNCFRSILVNGSFIFVFVPLSYANNVNLTKNLSIEHLNTDVRLFDPRISPNGKAIVLVTSRANLAKNQFENQLLLVDTQNGEQHALTHDRVHVIHPRWSPDGKTIAFLAAGSENKAQIFTLSLYGGEAMQLTNSKTHISSFAWSPNGQDIAYVTSVLPKVKKGIQRHNKSFEVGNHSFLTKKAPTPSYVWRVNVASGEMLQLTSGEPSVSNRSPAISWSVDGKSIAFDSQPIANANGYFNSQINIINSSDGSEDSFGQTIIKGGFAPGYSPNGKYITYGNSTGEEDDFTPVGIFIKPLNGTKEIHFSQNIDRNLIGTWMPDSQSMIMHAPDMTSKSIWQVSITGEVNKLNWSGLEPNGRISVADTGALAFVGSDVEHMTELYYSSSLSEKPKPLTQLNAQLNAMQRGVVSSINWNSHDGLDLNGVLIYPPNFDAKKKYPLVLDIHGGPMGSSTEAFTGGANISRHAMANEGWLVFSPNYRGSNNMGKDFQRAVINDPSVGPGKDVMAGVEAIKALGIVDEKRIAVSGWSYGGFMTAWLISHYDGWAAAVAGAAVTDFVDSYAFSDTAPWYGSGLGGSPWINNRVDFYWKNSPIAHAHKIKTPTLILSDTGDERVPISQSYKLYHALKDNGVEVQFIAYPIPGHFPHYDPVHANDIVKRWHHWIKDKFEKQN